MDRGAIVCRMNSTPIYMNVYQEVQKAKNEKEILKIVKKWHPGCTESTVDTYRWGYTKALRKGVPCVPLMERAVKVITKAKGSEQKRMEKRRNHHYRPVNGMFYDSSSGVWVKDYEYKKVHDYLMERKDATLKFLKLTFPDIKEYRISAVLKKMAKENEIYRKYLTEDYAWHFIVGKMITIDENKDGMDIEERQDIKRHVPFLDRFKHEERGDNTTEDK